MKWRCEWCGKPHEENEPPCDSCGHGSFEEAIVQEPDIETVDTGTQYIWICADCGRQHMRNNPPCSRCGGPDLEQTEQEYAGIEDELDAPSWLEVAKPYLPAFAVVGLVIVLFAAGIVPLSVVPGIGSPTPPDAPGEASTAGDLDLALVESEVHDRLEGERAAGDGREYDDGLAGFAAYLNAVLVVEEYTDDDPGSPPPLGEFDPACTGDTALVEPLWTVAEPIDAYDDEAALADDVAAALLASEFGEGVLTGYGAEGLDVHVGPGGNVHVVYAAC